MTQLYVTVGRAKAEAQARLRHRREVRSHTRTPRGPNAGAKRVRVDGYSRGAVTTSRKKRKKK